MKVLIFSYEYPPIGGGASTAIKNITDRFENYDLKVDLITSSPNDEYGFQEVHSGLNIYRIPVGKKNLHEWKNKEIIRFMLKGFSFGKGLSRKKDYDLVHSFSTFSCGIFTPFFDLPSLISLRGADVPGFENRFAFYYLFLKPIFRKVWRSANAVVANSEKLREQASKTAPNIKIGVIPNGVDVEMFKPDRNQRKGNFKLLSVARLISRKGLRYIIKALPEIKRDFDIKLLLVGDGPEKDYLENLAIKMGVKGQIEFYGRVPHEDMPKIYSEADIFILPSNNEGMSNVMLEAASFGLPLLVTPVGGSDELLDENGLLIRRDPEDIENKVRLLLDNDEMRKSMGKKSRKIAEELSWEKVAEQYYALYKEITLDSKR